MSDEENSLLAMHIQQDKEAFARIDASHANLAQKLDHVAATVAAQSITIAKQGVQWRVAIALVGILCSGATALVVSLITK